MYKKQADVNMQFGFHGRAVTGFVAEAAKYESSIKVEVEKNGKYKIGDGKSLLYLLSTEVVEGDKITISAEGNDEELAVNSLCEYVEGK